MALLFAGVAVAQPRRPGGTPAAPHAVGSAAAIGPISRSRGPARAAASASAAASVGHAPPPAASSSALEGGANAAPPTPTTTRYALTVSGGISLGAYEAGFNWAVLRLMKAQREGSPTRDAALRPHDLLAVTGASAGNINAVLSALAWCQRDELDAAEGLRGNVFWKTWVPVGWRQLFPRSTTCAGFARSAGLASLACQAGESAYGRDDGLLTRRAFSDVEAEIKQRLAEAERFRPGCSLPIGVTVTKVTPERIETADSSWNKLDVATQRMAVLLEARSCANEGGCAGEPGLAFAQPTFDLASERRDEAEERAAEAALFGKRLFVPPAMNGHIDVRTLLDVVEASSAFPLAFGPKVLHYCEGGDAALLDRCRREPLAAKFFDGGLFDNVPLGLAIGLASSRVAGTAARQAAQRSEGATPPKVTFIYLDPDRRRRSRVTPRANDRDDLGRGYAYLIRLVERFISVSRTYELQTTSRYRASTRHEIAPTSRLFPIMGQHLGAFAAFLSRPFREHDFYVGVYEAMFASASRACAERRQGAVWPEGKLAGCVAREVIRSYALLHLDAPDAGSASFVARRLLRLELDTWLDRSLADRVLLDEGRETLSWLDGAATDDELLAAVFEANLRMFHQARAPSDAQDAPEARFDALLEQTRDAARRAHLAGRLPDDEWRLFDDPETFYWQTARAISERLVTLENEDGRGLGKGLANAITFGVHAYSSGRSAGGNVDLDPSSIPPGSSAGTIAAHLLPYTGTTELVRGGLELGYRPTLHLSRSSALVWPVEPLSYTRVEDRTDARGGVGLLFKFDSALVNGVEFGPFARAHYRRDGAWAVGAPSIGAEVSLNTLLNHVRFTLGVNDIALFYDRPDGALSAPQVTLRMGLSDLNGIVYWGGRFLLQ